MYTYLSSDQIDMVISRLATDEEWQKSAISPEFRQALIAHLWEEQAELILDRVVEDVQKETKKPKKSSRTRKSKKVQAEPEGEHA